MLIFATPHPPSSTVSPPLKGRAGIKPSPYNLIRLAWLGTFSKGEGKKKPSP